MKDCLQTSLALQFPSLQFSVKADEWLSSINNKSIEEQLSERLVIETHATYMTDCEGFLALNMFEDGFIVYVNSESREKIQTLAHEIGHTFHFDLGDVPIKDTIPERWECGSEGLYRGEFYDLVEDFADRFGEKWLAVNGKDKIEAWRLRRNVEVLRCEQSGS